MSAGDLVTGAGDTVADVTADLAEPGFLEPSGMYPPGDVPEAVVLCFLPETVAAMGELDGARVATPITGLLEPRPLYEREHRGHRIGWCWPSVGAPRAVMIMEELVARGVRRFIAVGSAGVLVPDMVMGHPFVITSAVRDEGTSAHYVAPAPVIDAEPVGVRACEEALAASGAGYSAGRAWTTDAIYRENRSKVERRIAAGCAVVEMEAAAFLAVARYRDVRFGQFVFSADSLAGQEWDGRSWESAREVHEGVFWLAMDAAARLVELDS